MSYETDISIELLEIFVTDIQYLLGRRIDVSFVKVGQKFDTYSYQYESEEYLIRGQVKFDYEDPEPEVGQLAQPRYTVIDKQRNLESLSCLDIRKAFASVSEDSNYQKETGDSRDEVIKSTVTKNLLMHIHSCSNEMIRSLVVGELPDYDLEETFEDLLKSLWKRNSFHSVGYGNAVKYIYTLFEEYVKGVFTVSTKSRAMRDLRNAIETLMKGPDLSEKASETIYHEFVNLGYEFP